MNFQRIGILFWNTFQKEYRNKTLLFFFFITLFVIFGVNFVLDLIGEFGKGGMIPEDQLSNKKLTLVFTIINMWNFILSIFVGLSVVRSDFRQGVLEQLLSFPVKREEYLISRFLGAWSIVFSYYLISLFCAIITFSLSSGNVSIGIPFILSLLVNGLAIFGSVVLAIFTSLFFSRNKGLMILFIL